MKRLFSEFNQNILGELAQTETVDKKKIKKAKERLESDYKSYREFANAQGVLTRRIKKYEKTDPALAESFRDTKEEYIKLKDAAKAIYDNQNRVYKRLAGLDYDITINIISFPNSHKPEYKKPLYVSKSRLAKMANPAAFILKEERTRLKYEIEEANKEISLLGEKLLNGITPAELARMRQLQSSNKGLGTLLKKADSSLKTAVSSQSARAIGQSKEEEEEEEDYDEEEEEEEEEDKKIGSADMPFFYTPLEGFIDVY